MERQIGRQGRVARALGRLLPGGSSWRRPELLNSIVPTQVDDPVGRAVADGIAAGNRGRATTPDVRLCARAIRDQARASGQREAALAELLSLIRDYPAVAEFQKIAARLLGEMRDPRVLPAWLGVSLRFPSAMDALHNLAIAVRQHVGPDAVRVILRARFSRMPRRLDELLAYAEACDLAGATGERRAAFDRIARLFASRNDAWLQTAAWLEEEVGVHHKLATLLRRISAGAWLGAPVLRRGRRLEALVDDGGAGRADTASVRVLGTLFERVLGERAAERGRLASRAAGPLMLLTGSLGAGGAERQLVTTAAGLARAGTPGRVLADGLALDPVSVVARSLNDRRDGAFFLSDLRAADVAVQSYRELPDFAGNLSTSAVRPALSALGFLPWSTAEAIIKLTDWLRARDPAVVHVWQDGLIYAVGLAALLAGVPRIVLSGRSTPPPDRRENYLVEYDVIYRSLLRAPGVVLSVNSHHAARRYATWLDIDPARVAVVHNGVSRLPASPDPDSEAAFRAFDAQTGPASFTIGGVMRLDKVKRPVLWIEAAAGVLARVPDARCVIVGDGPLRAKAEARAQALGIARRCLFAGRSSCVGYWISKMDCVMLLSEQEGLPNSLIEAQLGGVPVITTPAGGAPETLRPGSTGLVTGADPTPHEIGDLVAALAAEPDRLKAMGEAATHWAEEAFPVSRMLSNTLALYATAGRNAGG